MHGLASTLSLEDLSIAMMVSPAIIISAIYGVIREKHSFFTCDLPCTSLIPMTDV